jgi:hypothetical protein
MISRPPTLSPKEMDQLLERLANSGARITMADPRVTSIQTWLMASIGAALVGGIGWGVKSINDLNVTVARVVTQNENRDDRIGRVERHVEAVDVRVLTLERSSVRQR